MGPLSGVVPRKHKEVPGIELAVLRDLLAFRESRNLRWLLPSAMDRLRLSAPEADSLLRRVAEAGYIEWAEPGGIEEEWVLTPRGSRLLADPLHDRLDREQAEAVLGVALDRIRKINKDPDRLIRVREARLFGSLLEEDAESFGDVDLELVLDRRPLSESERSRISKLVLESTPGSWRSHSILQYLSAEALDERMAVREIGRHQKYLSVSQDTIEDLGCAYRVIFAWDCESGVEMEPSGEIFPRAAPLPDHADNAVVAPVPETTIIPPIGLLQPDEEFPAERLSVSTKNLSYQEAQAWMGVSGEGSTREALNVRKSSSLRFAGAIHLFPEWRDEGLSGLELLARALDWARDHDLPISHVPRSFSLQTYERTRTAHFAGLEVRRVADRIDAQLIIRDFSSPYPSLNVRDQRPSLREQGGASAVTPRMVAANYAVCVALGRMLDETRLTGQVRSRLDFNLDDLHCDTWPVIPDLSPVSRVLRRLLPRVEIPEDVLAAAVRRAPGRQHIAVNRDAGVKIVRTLEESSTLKVMATADFSQGAPGAEVDRDGEDEELPGEVDLVLGLFDEVDKLYPAIEALPGCQEIMISHSAPIRLQDWQETRSGKLRYG